jgi:putative sterol carrier protein
MAVQTTPALFLSDMEELWGITSELLDSIEPADWTRKHGPDWTYADVPYHISYFDRLLVAEPLKQRVDDPDPNRQPMRTLGELNAWNEERFAERSADQTVEEALEQMRAGWDAIRSAVADLTEEDLARHVFLPLPAAGWLTVERALEGARAHAGSHATELRLRLQRGRSASPAVMSRMMDFYSRFMPTSLNTEEARKRDFVFVMDLTGPGGGTWTYTVKDGECVRSEGRADGADLTMSMTADTMFKAMLLQMQNPMVAMLTRRLRVKGLRKMPTFMKLFPKPKLDQALGSLA